MPYWKLIRDGPYIEVREGTFSERRTEAVISSQQKGILKGEGFQRGSTETFH